MDHINGNSQLDEFFHKHLDELVFLSSLRERDAETYTMRKIATKMYGRSVHRQCEIFLTTLEAHLNIQIEYLDFAEFLDKATRHPMAKALVEMWFCVEETLMMDNVAVLHQLLSKTLWSLFARIKSTRTPTDLIKKFQQFLETFENKATSQSLRRHSGVVVQKACLVRIASYWWHRLQRCHEHAPALHRASFVGKSPSFLPPISSTMNLLQSSQSLEEELLALAKKHKQATSHFLIHFFNSDRRAGWPFLFFAKDIFSVTTHPWKDMTDNKSDRGSHILHEIVKVYEIIQAGRGRSHLQLSIRARLNEVICAYVEYIKGGDSPEMPLTTEEDRVAHPNCLPAHVKSSTRSTRSTTSSSLSWPQQLKCILPALSWIKPVHMSVLQLNLQDIAPTTLREKERNPVWRIYVALLHSLKEIQAVDMKMISNEIALHNRYHTARHKLSHHSFQAFVSHVEEYLLRQKYADATFVTVSTSNMEYQSNNGDLQQVSNLMDKPYPQPYFALLEEQDERAAKFYKFVSAPSVMEKFRHYLFRQGYGNENALLFWMKVQQYRSIPQAHFAELGFFIYYSYIHPSSGSIRFKLNEKIVLDVGQKVESGALSRTTFDACAHALLPQLLKFVKPFKREIERAKKLGLYKTQTRLRPHPMHRGKHKLLKFSLGEGVRVFNVKTEAEERELTQLYK
eukprot:m.95525 g.95525  ORF g.95525 m.95525 type:complete len:681 (+) comp8950_c0_seq2:260-2302(+)